MTRASASASASFAFDRLDQERLLLLLDPVPAIGPALRPSPATDR